MNKNWPYIDITTQVDPEYMPTPDKIIITYFPTTGGQFFARTLSCSEDFYGVNFQTTIKENYEKKFSTTKHENLWPKSYEGMYHPKICAIHPRILTFDEWLQYDKLIYIDFQNTEKEINWLLFRRNYVGTTATSDILADCQMKYEKELIRFLEERNKKIYKVPFACFLNSKSYTVEVNKCLEHFSLKKIDDSIILEIWQSWYKLNLKLSAKQNKIPITLTKN